MLSLDSSINSSDQSNQGRGWIVSLVTHILVIIALCLPMIVFKTPPPEQEGLLVNLGLPDEGQGEETPKGTESEPTPEPEVEPNQEVVKEVAKKLQLKKLPRRVSPAMNRMKYWSENPKQKRRLKLMHNERLRKKRRSKQLMPRLKSLTEIC